MRLPRRLPPLRLQLMLRCVFDDAMLMPRRCHGAFARYSATFFRVHGKSAVLRHAWRADNR